MMMSGTAAFGQSQKGTAKGGTNGGKKTQAQDAAEYAKANPLDNGRTTEKQRQAMEAKNAFLVQWEIDNPNMR